VVKVASSLVVSRAVSKAANRTGSMRRETR
jgi:hypothetical protein